MLLTRFWSRIGIKKFKQYSTKGTTQAQYRLEKLRAMAPKSRENPVIFKLESEDFKSLFTDELNTLSSLFKKYGYEIRIAGGAVRDLLSNLKPKDLDFATNATPTEMKDMFTKEKIRMINANGEKHGTITPRINDKENFEVTTLRIDVVTDGRHAEVQFTTDWLLDANRRDLTINSMFLDFDGFVYDYFYGYEDLKSKRVAFVGKPESRIQEDYLRILRYFRFFGRISNDPNSHDEETLKAIANNASGLERISGERIWVELKKILEGNFAGELLEKIIECNCAPYIGLPEKCSIDELRRVWIQINDNNINLHSITLLSTLVNTEEDALKLHRRMKFSNFERDLLFFMVLNREPKLDSLRPLHPYKMLVVNSRSDHARDFTVELMKYANSPLIDEFLAWKLPKMPINGIILKDNNVPNKKMGFVLDNLKKIWAESNFSLGTDELVKEIPRILSEMPEIKKIKR